MRDNATGFPLLGAITFFGILLGTSVGIYAVLWAADFYGVAQGSPLELITREGAIATLTNFGEVALGVLGVAVTVVAIIVELAANRYTPRITEMFIRDPINVITLGFFVVTAVLVIWVDMSLFHETAYPVTMVSITTVLMTVSLLVLLPYFAYVFDFLSPVRVIQRIQGRGIRSITTLRRRGASGVEDAREEVMMSVEQLGDIALNSVDKKDKGIGIATVDALSGLARAHVDQKSTLPSEWFDAEPLVGSDQDFVAFHPDIIRALTLRHTWVEMKIFRQYQAVFGEALHKMRDIAHLVAIRTRQVAIHARRSEDGDALILAIRFMNTYMRAALNARDVRTAYNLMNEYRLLAEQLIKIEADDDAIEVADFVKRYGQLAFNIGIPFILESAAYDLATLLEFAWARNAPSQSDLLAIFLDVDREPEGGRGQEASLRGVRKAQIKLATFYLFHDREDLARRIFEDMKSEQADRLTSIRAELEAVEEAEFWEVSDRGINFEYLPPEQRAELDTFFAWFAP